MIQLQQGYVIKLKIMKDNERKVISPKDILFHDLGWRLKPSESENFNMKLYKDQINYKTGKYRIVKYYLNSDYQKTKETHNVYGQFDIK